MRFQAIIFDLDGVICFTDEYHFRAWKALADKLNTPFDREINNRLRGVSRMASLEIVLENYTGPALSSEQKLALATEKNEIYRESLREMRPEARDRLLLQKHALHPAPDRSGGLFRRRIRRQQHHPLQARPRGVPEGRGVSRHRTGILHRGGRRRLRRGGGARRGHEGRLRGRRRRERSGGLESVELLRACRYRGEIRERHGCILCKAHSPERSRDPEGGGHDRRPEPNCEEVSE